MHGYEGCLVFICMCLFFIAMCLLILASDKIDNLIKDFKDELNANPDIKTLFRVLFWVCAGFMGIIVFCGRKR